MVTSRVVRRGRRAKPLGEGNTEADKYFHGLIGKGMTPEQARKAFQESSY